MKTLNQGKEKGKERVPNVRWYDARARAALRRVALWLGVSWAPLAEAERHLAARCQAPEPTESAASGAAKSKAGRYLAVGGAAALGGTLLAITGEEVIVLCN